MSNELLSSKVVVIEEEPRVRAVPAAPTSVAAAVGICQRGPIDTPVLCTSFEEFQQIFGDFTRDGDLPLAAMGFFENGGARLWCVRTCHHTSIDSSGSATARRAFGYLVSSGAPTPAIVTGSFPAPFRLADEDKLSVQIGGASHSAVFRGKPACLYSAHHPFALMEGMTLSVRIDGGPVQKVEFFDVDFASIAKASAEEVASVLNEQLEGACASVVDGAVELRSDVKGSSSRVEVTGGAANGVLGFPASPAMGTGNVADIRNVTVIEAQTVIESAIPGIVVSSIQGGFLTLRTTATGVSASLQVVSTSSEGFGFDHDTHYGQATGSSNAVRVEGKDAGAYANNIEVEVRLPASGEVGAFDLAVVEDGVYREVYRNLRMTPGHPQYVETQVNSEKSGSALIRVVDQLAPGSPSLAVQTIALSSGDDGLVGLDDTDFIGSAAGQTGMRALDRVQDIAILLVPGRATEAVHNAMLQYCEVERDGALFAVLDPPVGLSATGMVDYVESTARLLNASEFGAIYWPRVKVLNPSKSVFGTQRLVTVAPSGIVAGVYARTDAARPGGVYEPPAGIDTGRMFGVLGFETDEVLEERKRDLVYPKRINPLTTGTGLPRYIDGSRTLKGDGNFPYVAERRGVTFIERSLKTGLQFARHKNNTEGLRAVVRRTITSFLLTQMNNGAFRSQDPKLAFFVDVSEQLNTPTVIFQGKLIARVGLATNKPAEFIVLRIAQDTRALEAELASAG